MPSKQSGKTPAYEKNQPFEWLENLGMIAQLGIRAGQKDPGFFLDYGSSCLNYKNMQDIEHPKKQIRL